MLIRNLDICSATLYLGHDLMYLFQTAKLDLESSDPQKAKIITICLVKQFKSNKTYCGFQWYFLASLQKDTQSSSIDALNNT